MENYKKLYQLLIDYDKEQSELLNLPRQFLKPKQAKDYLEPALQNQNGLKVIWNINGFIIFQRLRNYYNLVDKIYIIPESRRQNLATKTFKILETPIILECHKNNKIAKKFYKSLDFEKIGKSAEPDFYWYGKGDPDDLWLSKYLVKYINQVRLKNETL